mmetsp:Transcript_25234/g.59860  ORF Transcript_25234/g.59860 Transcript_25234/m.59860 type:complete len:493 (+) Transcript_25234:969-2447(+)
MSSCRCASSTWVRAWRSWEARRSLAADSCCASFPISWTRASRVATWAVRARFLLSAPSATAFTLASSISLSCARTSAFVARSSTSMRRCSARSARSSASSHLEWRSACSLRNDRSATTSSSRSAARCFHSDTELSSRITSRFSIWAWLPVLSDSRASNLFTSVCSLSTICVLSSAARRAAMLSSSSFATLAWSSRFSFRSASSAAELLSVAACCLRSDASDASRLLARSLWNATSSSCLRRDPVFSLPFLTSRSRVFTSSSRELRSSSRVSCSLIWRVAFSSLRSVISRRASVASRRACTTSRARSSISAPRENEISFCASAFARSSWSLFWMRISLPLRTRSCSRLLASVVRVGSVLFTVVGCTRDCMSTRESVNTRRACRSDTSSSGSSTGILSPVGRTVGRRRLVVGVGTCGVDCVGKVAEMSNARFEDVFSSLTAEGVCGALFVCSSFGTRSRTERNHLMKSLRVKDAWPAFFCCRGRSFATNFDRSS